MADAGFRFDINGLRAWAILAVLLFHFGIPGVSGGFAGVDVFFVISGFLMASIVCHGLEHGNFSIASFYLSRAIRILPALIVVVAALLIVGWHLLMPSDYKILAKHARGSLFFVSNLQFLEETGYFDIAAQQKWLLHTWSLSVEWQFYLLYPFLLWLAYRTQPGLRTLWILHAGLLAISLLACLLPLPFTDDSRFYQLAFRAWELLAGSCVFLATRFHPHAIRHHKWLERLGFVAILGSMTLIDETRGWPGLWTLLPVAGSALVLLAARQHSPWTGLPVLQWLGTRSYSIYLWHWPVSVAIQHFGLHQQIVWTLTGIAISLILGEFSFRLIEQPSRRYLGKLPLRRAATHLVLAVIILTVALIPIRRTGIPARLPQDILIIDQARHDNNPRQRECLGSGEPCHFGGNNLQGMVVGDSHADAVVTAAVASLADPSQGLLFLGASACLFTIEARDLPSENPGCQRLRVSLFEQLARLPAGKPVLLVSRTTIYAYGPPPPDKSAGKPLVYFTRAQPTTNPEFMAEFAAHYIDSVCRIAQRHPVYLLQPIPEMPEDVPIALGRQRLSGQSGDIRLPRADYASRHAPILAMQREAAERCPGVSLLDPLPLLCDREFCYGNNGDRPLYSDSHHLNEFGNRVLTGLFSKVFNKGTDSANSLAGH